MDDLTDIPHIASPLLYLFNGELVRISAFIKENKGTIAYGNLYGLRTHSESPVVHVATLKTKPKEDRFHIAKESSNDYSLDLVGEWYSCEYMPFTLREFLRTRLFQLAENETKFVVMVSKKESTTDTDPLCLDTFFLVAKAGVICKVDKKILNRESPFRFVVNLATELESIEYQSTDDHDQANIEEGKHNGFGPKLNGEIRERHGRTRRETDTPIEMTRLEQSKQHCMGGLKEVKVKVNDGTNDGNTNLSNGLDANLSTQRVPESQYGSLNDQNTSNFDNGSETEKIEGKEDDKAEDMISNNLQTQTDTINGGLEEVKVKVNDGTNDGNTNLSNGLDANLSTQHVPESQYGSSNDQNTSNFDNGSGTEKIEEKEDDKAEDMISNNLQTQTDTINGTQTRQSSDFQEKNEVECPNKDDEDGEDRETSETHGGSETEQEPRDVNSGTGQKSKPNGMETEVETSDCPSERNSVPQSTDDDEKIIAASNGISSYCDDAKDASKDGARNECQPKDETDKQTTETQKGFETDRSLPNINRETEEPKPTSTEVRAEPMEENVLGQPLKKDQRSESPKLDDPAAADNSRETPSDDEDHDDSTASSHETESDQSNDPDIEDFPADPLSQTNGQPIIANEEYDKLTKVIIEKIEETPSIPPYSKNVGSRKVKIALKFQSTKYQLTCEKKGATFRKTTVILKVGHEQLVETEIYDSIEEIAKFAADKILQHNNIK